MTHRVWEPARRAHSSHKQRLEQKDSGYTLGPHFVLALVHASSPFLQCHGHVCRFLTGLACAASFNPFLFPCEAVHCMLVMLCSSHGPHVALQTCKPKSCHFALPYVSYSLPHAPFLHCPSSVLDHGVHLHRVMHFFTSTMCCGTHQLSSLVNC